ELSVDLLREVYIETSLDDKVLRIARLVFKLNVIADFELDRLDVSFLIALRKLINSHLTPDLEGEEQHVVLFFREPLELVTLVELEADRDGIGTASQNEAEEDGSSITVTQ